MSGSELNVLGVTVRFPFTPYDCQRDYMSRVIECLQQKKNGVLESPTGTGKTLCLLCATLAWREHFKDTISARKIADRLKGAEMFPDTPLASWGNAATDADSNTYYTDIPKIIYASRTHSQLAQVISELKNTTYRPKVCVLGSREQLCVNQEVMRQESNHVKSVSVLPVPLAQAAGRLIFMPYNYLLDPKSRRAHNIELNQAVIIFDEAHNVERTCEESTSFDLTPYDLSSAIAAVDGVLAEQAKEMKRSDTALESFSADSLSAGLKLDISTIAKIKQILLDLEEAIDSFDIPSDRGVTRPGIFIYELLEKAHLNYGTKTAVSEALDQITGHLAGQQGVFLNTSGLQKLADIIQVHIHKDNFQKKKQTGDLWASSAPKKQGNILSYWCFSPGFSMQELVSQGVRSIILTSGTLSPLASFTSEMRIDFPIRLENSHVIERDQIYVSVVDRGPDGVQLTSAFDRRFLPENMGSLGSTVANLSRVVPHGLLVFFPSFPLMEKTLEFWREKGQADRIENLKPMFVEPKGKGTFTEVIEGYYNKVDDPVSKGGSFFAVCRGKASEGLDFADSYGRGVIITGLPFPPKMDPRVILKMQFLDEMCRKKTPGVKYLTGQEWYRQQAFRAVNQAVGRVIRHKEDYGAIFLCDERFKGPSAISQLPKWVRPYVRTYAAFGNVVRDVSQFFRVAQKMRPPVEKKPSAQNSSSSSSRTTFSSQTWQAQKAKALDAHIPSLKRRRLEDHSGPNGMAKICLSYESGAPESHRRPTSLLDALEHGPVRGQGEETWAGEEKASRLSTLSLQFDKRMDDEQRGGKRKIKLVQDQTKLPSEDTSEEGKASRAKLFLAEMKKSLSQLNFERVIQALQTYKKTDDVDKLLLETGALAEDANTHSLLRGFYQFVRPHHKQKFDEQCRRLTGQGCGFKPDHSLSKEDKKALIQQEQPGGKHGSTCSLLNTQQLNHLNSEPVAALSSSSQLSTQLLNQGEEHLTCAGLRQPQPQTQTVCAPKTPGTFLADVKAALGPEKSSQLFQAVHSYKQTDNYEQLVSVLVSLLTERDQDFHLLTRFLKFIRPHHKAQYKDLLQSLMGQTCAPAEAVESQTCAAEAVASEEPPAENVSPVEKTQSKISSFFPRSQRK
ncbi:hypothetical protein WMY93_027607 [Mugilogobius chulae]|uniref:Regulator of telomere elongation helicase 1 n=1 Tax=Mugilogobius chulae TaxID=88201 RepID=A0AAW0MTF6_9GOBI